MRLVVAALVASSVASLAFAPAPLPRRERENAQEDLVRIQGVWDRIIHNGQPAAGVSIVEVKGDVWRTVVSNHSWKIKLDQTARPRRIDLVYVHDPAVYCIGVYKIEGDRLTYSIRREDAKEEQRPLDFGPHQPWVSVFVRRKP